MTTIDTGITESDLMKWLDEQPESWPVPKFDPDKHITFVTIMERRKVSESVAKKMLADMVDVGKLKSVGMVAYANGKRKEAFVVVKPA